jgi:choline dehydrogenase-like flavoprotein
LQRQSVHETTFAETTVAVQLNQGERKKRVVYRFFLDFFVTFCVKTKSKRKKTEIKNKKIATPGAAYRSRQQHNAVIGAELKDPLTGPGAWSFSIYAFGETLPYADNRITLNHDKKDSWGRPTITIDCNFRDNENAMHKDIADTGKEILEAAGYKDVKVSGSISFPGNANHEMGIARMGKDPKTSVLNAFNQMHEVSNVFITDGSCTASSNCVNPSLTYMALTARACDYAVKEMKKGNI